MKGFRSIGKRKAKLINGPLNKRLEELNKHGINGLALLKEKYGIKDMDDFLKIPTKKISGMISDLADLK